jgi:hypothetical protein
MRLQLRLTMLTHHTTHNPRHDPPWAGSSSSGEERMTLSIVPALKARVLAVEFVKNNPRLRALVDHPAGPFTSEWW